MKTATLTNRCSPLTLPFVVVMCVLCLVFQTHGQSTNGLWGYWSFDDGTAVDLSGNSRNGIINGAVTATVGWSGQALSFDGTGGFINCGTGEFLSNATIVAFVQMPADFLARTTFSYGNIVQRWAGEENFAMSVYPDQSGTLRFMASYHPGISGVGMLPELHIYSDTTPKAGQYYLLAMTYGSDNVLRLYVNGVLEKQVAADLGFYITCCRDSDLRVGLNFKGILDEVRIYNRALTISEIQSLYLNPSPATYPRIVMSPVGMVASPGENVNFNVAASGLQPFGYQWYRNKTLITNTEFFYGLSGPFLTISNIQPEHAGAYSVVVTNFTGSVTSGMAVLTVLDGDDDGDGLPNSWENTFGLNPNNPEDALLKPAGELLTYVQKHNFQLSPITSDTDNDGLTDHDELYVYRTNPLLADSDSDGIPDSWELAHGMNPMVADAHEEAGFNGVKYWQVYQHNQLNTNQLNPRQPFAAGAGISNFEIINGGQHTNRFYYDRTDRLVGAEYSRGISIAYQYDGNGNLVHQAVLSRARETNGLPVLWQTLHGLTNSTFASGAYGDPDGDGWNNYQEWKAGTNPTNAQSTPNLLGNLGINIAALALPFTPSNFVVAVGQLDGMGAEEIVVGGDGNPGTNTNFLLVLTQGPTSWSTQRVDVGPFGITSIAVGQPANRPSPAIYVGLCQVGGAGRIMELLNSGGVWHNNGVAFSTNNTAYVLGVQFNGNLLGSLSPTNGADGGVYSLSYAGSNWNSRILDTFISHRGLGLTVELGTNQTWLRLLDVGGIEVGPTTLQTLPTNAVYNPSAGKWYFPTPYATNWTGAQAYARLFGGDLATVTDAALSTNLASQFSPSLGLFWIGASRTTICAPHATCGWTWASGAPFGYYNWDPSTGEPNHINDIEFFAEMRANGTWNDASPTTVNFGVVELAPEVYFGLVSSRILEPDATKRLNWRGMNMSSSLVRGPTANMASVLYAFVDDKNMNNIVDVGDDYVLSEFRFADTNHPVLTLSRTALPGSFLAQSYGLASVNTTGGHNETVFTGEPDGQVFSWTATNASGPLQRQLFNAQYSGKAWHALAGVKTSEPGEGLIGLMVDPNDQSKGNIIFWPPQSALNPLANIAQTAPLARILPEPALGQRFAVVPVRVWDGEGNNSMISLQYSNATTLAWSNATMSSIDGLAPGFVMALPTGTTHHVVWDAAADLGMGYTNDLYLRVRATDVSLTGDWSEPALYRVEIPAGTVQEFRLLDPSFTTAEGHFRFELAGFNGERYRIDTSTNLIHWTTNAATITNSNGRAVFSDVISPALRSKYYRAVLEQ